MKLVRTTYQKKDIHNFLVSENKPVSAKYWLEELGLDGRITKIEIEKWFRGYFVFEDAYRLFRKMECVCVGNMEII